ncbi:hypothetical protein V4P56_01175 [Bartonella sp. B35(2025)]
MNIASLHVPNLNYGVNNEDTIEGKIEKVLEPVTIGTFGLGVATGYGSTVISALVGWIIAKIVQLIRAYT